MDVVPMCVKLLAPEGLVIVAEIIHTHSTYTEITRHIVYHALEKDQG